ncbi:hypothetical protein D2E26_0774 [Bifidobacterium dolichotidis]|uniref:Uncharacterized protein n=2 Tax=Bifidobacterium dolichotidis TaxID=2306976 RepID=A0A430FPF7_9BIFI|nr:hypothetical protein D2E26_0774 [Bifidobacterium dolichotidis]
MAQASGADNEYQPIPVDCGTFRDPHVLKYAQDHWDTDGKGP